MTFKSSFPYVNLAAAIQNVPSGNISAVDVQSAINELDSEKQSITGLTGASTKATPVAGDGFVIVDSADSNKLKRVLESDLLNLIPAGTPVGTLIYVPATAAPTGFIKANGALISRTTYSALYAFAVASGNIVADGSWAKGNFSTGDLSTTFRIPDGRGYFPRGWDDSAGIDSARTIGSYQADDNKAHTHSIASGFDKNQQYFILLGCQYNDGPTSTGSSGGTEARPKNIALLACIKY